MPITSNEERRLTVAVEVTDEALFRRAMLGEGEEGDDEFSTELLRNQIASKLAMSLMAISGNLAIRSGNIASGKIPVGDKGNKIRDGFLNTKIAGLLIVETEWKDD